METLLIVIAIGVGAYWFFKANTRRGAETVRAYVYIGGILAGRSPEEANRVAAFDMTNAPTDIIRGAMNAVKNDYNGKQLAMIAEAYRLGMVKR